MAAYTLAAAAYSELLIKKSRFLGCVEPMADRATAQQRVAQLRAQHPDAAHICWALLAGGHSAAVDDGEPGGTAGRPMLDVLRHQGLEQVMASVVRYYGGVRLGAAGLVRAYGDAVAQALQGAERIRVHRLCVRRCRLPYSLEGVVRRELERVGATLVALAHADDVQLDIAAAEALWPELQRQLSERCAGRLQWLDSSD